MAKFKPGHIITVQPRQMFWMTRERYTLQSWSARVLAVAADTNCYICEGLTTQSAMSAWVQETCKAAGLDPNQKIRLGYASEVVGEDDDTLTLDYTPEFIEGILPDLKD